MFKKFKNIVDPDNIFGANNTIYKNEDERQKDQAHKIKAIYDE